LLPLLLVLLTPPNLAMLPRLLQNDDFAVPRVGETGASGCVAADVAVDVGSVEGGCLLRESMRVYNRFVSVKV